jgi:uncharacterized membrane protein YdjX (TVP38/TMEM64 family)
MNDERLAPAADHQQADTEAQLKRRLLWARLIGLLLAVVGVSAAMVVWGADTILTTLEERATGGWVGVAVFILVYALATTALVPGSAATATAGALYGPVAGGAVAVVGATLGAIGGYLISRSVAREAAEVLLAPRARQVESFLANNQFRTVLILRLLPVVPFSAFNYAAGLTPIRLRPFAAGTFLGIVPATFLLALVGDALRDPTSPTFIGSVALFVALVVASSVAARRFTANASAAGTSDGPDPATGRPGTA